MQGRDLYTLLGVERTAIVADIEKAYNTKVQSLHAGETTFKEMAAAYETLSDPTKRLAYDMRISEPSSNARSGKFYDGFPYEYFNDYCHRLDVFFNKQQGDLRHTWAKDSLNKKMISRKTYDSFKKARFVYGNGAASVSKKVKFGFYKSNLAKIPLLQKQRIELKRYFKDFIKPYQSMISWRNDFLWEFIQPFRGIINLMMGVTLGVFILPALLLFSVAIVIGGPIKSLRHSLGIDLASRFKKSLNLINNKLLKNAFKLCTRGLAQIVSTPLLLMKIPARSLNTLKNGHEKVETRASFQRVLKEANQALVTENLPALFTTVAVLHEKFRYAQFRKNLNSSVSSADEMHQFSEFANSVNMHNPAFENYPSFEPRRKQGKDDLNLKVVAYLGLFPGKTYLKEHAPATSPSPHCQI